MPSDRQLPTLYALLHSVVRLLGWLTDLGAIVILGYIVRCWPEKGGTVAAGLVGVGSCPTNNPICRPGALLWSCLAHPLFPLPRINAFSSELTIYFHRPQSLSSTTAGKWCPMSTPLATLYPCRRPAPYCTTSSRWQYAWGV